MSFAVCLAMIGGFRQPVVAAACTWLLGDFFSRFFFFSIWSVPPRNPFPSPAVWDARVKVAGSDLGVGLAPLFSRP